MEVKTPIRELSRAWEKILMTLMIWIEQFKSNF